jgi:hypothetical protein
MRTVVSSIILSFMFLVSVSDGFSQTVRSDIGTKLLIPSSARTASFTSFLAILNLDSQPNEVIIRARREDGSLIGEISKSIPVGGKFRSVDILGELGAAVGEFGPITVESTNGKVLSAVSEVSSSQGPAGFFPGVNVETAWMQGFLPEVLDTGDLGTPKTFRTNIGLNTVGTASANVTIVLYDNVGTQLGSTSTTVPGNGMKQINGIIRTLLNSGGAVTGRDGFLRIASDQPIIAWAAKVENGTGDPSFQIGIATNSISPAVPFSVPAIGNLWLAGQPDGVVYPGPSAINDSTPLNSPTLVPIGVSEGQVFLINATGVINAQAISGTVPPSGDLFSAQRQLPFFGLSGINCSLFALVGVFLGPGLPDPSSTPPILDFTGAAKDVTTLHPLLQQAFYIGDGRTSGGVSKNFVAPSGATRLFLGLAFGENGGNSGAFQATVFTP